MFLVPQNHLGAIANFLITLCYPWRDTLQEGRLVRTCETTILLNQISPPPLPEIGTGFKGYQLRALAQSDTKVVFKKSSASEVSTIIKCDAKSQNQGFVDAADRTISCVM